MTPNASRAVWSATRGCWIALHRESGGRLLLIRADTKERASDGGFVWRNIRLAEEFDMPLFKGKMIEQSTPTKE